MCKSETKFSYQNSPNNKKEKFTERLTPRFVCGNSDGIIIESNRLEDAYCFFMEILCNELAVSRSGEVSLVTGVVAVGLE